MFLSIVIPTIFAFLTTLIITPKIIKFAKAAGIVGIDIMKRNKPKVAEFGSPPVIFGFMIGTFAYIAAQRYLIRSLPIHDLLVLMAAITSLIIAALIGMFDELTTLIKREGKRGIEKFKRIGLPQWFQPASMVIASLPLIAIAAGDYIIHIPFIGPLNLGIIYPLVLIPIAVTGAANATNMLAGFNGLQASLGIIMGIGLGTFAFLHRSAIATILGFTWAGALAGFLVYNWYPSKIFPGSLDYLNGVMIATIAIVGNIEFFSVLAFLPWFIELFLKARSKFKAENFGIIQKDGTLKPPYKKCYSILHCIMKIKPMKEWEVTICTNILLILWIIIIWITLGYLKNPII